MNVPIVLHLDRGQLETFSLATRENVPTSREDSLTKQRTPCLLSLANTPVFEVRR